MAPKERLFGLDLLRAAAVLVVVFHHSLAYLSAPAWLRAFGHLGELGVGALLVLSGYLIGHGLMRKTEQGRFSRVSHLWDFYLRRWTRTLPPYYFFLLMMAGLFPPFFAELAAHKEYFLFLQNFAWNIPPFYAQTWTLAVLEFFYLLFPLLLLATSALVRNRLICLAVPMALLFFIPLVLRALHTEILSPDQFEQGFRKWVVCRLDTPIIGVAAALIEIELPRVWAWFLNRSWIGLGTFSLTVAYHFQNCPGLFSSHWIQVFLYPVSALAMAPLLPFLSNWKSNRSLFGRATVTVSQVSYSLYVSHYFAFLIGLCLLTAIGVPHDGWLVAYAAYIPLIAVATCVGYYITEAPFIRIREGKTGSVFTVLGNFAGGIFRTVSRSWTPGAGRDRAVTDQPSS